MSTSCDEDEPLAALGGEAPLAVAAAPDKLPPVPLADTPPGPVLSQANAKHFCMDLSTCCNSSSRRCRS
jgi:hypothetical protein